ncbi:MAG: hypothetical protein LC781_08555 [Actinobacteria bacterium]|nr:hypothetical protein [Actinomycetota bacterium]
MIEDNHNGETQRDERNRDERDPDWEGFKDYVKKMAAVPKEELDEKLAEEKREKEEKRAG